MKYSRMQATQASSVILNEGRQPSQFLVLLTPPIETYNLFMNEKERKKGEGGGSVSTDK
jgi:hypothetical protein